MDSGTENTIAGAAAKTYVPVADDVGRTLKVAVSFTDDASNAEGPLTSEATTEVLASRPGALTDLDAALGDARVTLTWTAAPDGGTPVTKHSYRQRTGDNPYRNWTDIPDSAEGRTNDTSYTVTGLANNTAYTFQVRAVNAQGAGPEATQQRGHPAAVHHPVRTLHHKRGREQRGSTRLPRSVPPAVAPDLRRNAVRRSTRGRDCHSRRRLPPRTRALRVPG